MHENMTIIYQIELTVICTKISQREVLAMARCANILQHENIYVYCSFFVLFLGDDMNIHILSPVVLIVLPSGSEVLDALAFGSTYKGILHAWCIR